MDKIPLLKALRNDRWVRPFLRKYRWTLVLAISLGVLTFVCAGGLMFTAGYLISRCATMPFNILLVYVPIVLTRAFGIFRPVFHYAERLTSHNWVFKMTSMFRKKLYDSLERDAVFFNSKYRIGDVLGLLSEDVAHIQNLYLRTIFPMLVACGLYLIIVISLGVLTPWMGLLMLVLFGLIIFGIPVWSILVNGARQEQEKQATNRLYSDLTDNVMGITDWVLSGNSGKYMRRHDSDEKKLFSSQRVMHRFNNLRDFVLQMMILLVIISVIAWASYRFGGHWGANWIAAFVLCVFPIDEALVGLPAAAQQTNVYTDSLVRLNKLPEPAKVNRQVPQIKAPYQINVDNVSFKYSPSTKLILERLNLTIMPGEKLAILGRSGTGKSTMASLIRGDLYPTEGKITINGVPTDEFGDHIADYIGVVHQSPYLFNTTVLNNIRLGNEDATEEDVWNVLKRVGLEEKIRQLPDGLNTKIGEAGLIFSGGERHRLSLARILLKDVPIVILDEPTVGLDPLTEQQVIDTFINELAGKTLIWITHHLQGIDAMDRVIFLENGRITMSGTPHELWETNSHYQKLKKADQGLLN
ncbi:thiol reductant ABC exporter subunit CydC [Limosilactobacillus fastidiosus]|uniref:Thiol reductant ABC exporter subunit CydC n=2 Tax=Limosilactobacillus fastidiosus TaxID=2759855 RepID=A0A7W3TYM1_9LACO|nr:thiol reductant ABC exporter subunit CydC [Limosilactobacillus fastidiosus]MBB1063063.1 thiol reductant ABC exporter subunit CydC [Limosilactobacillus fastidiosus]MBB1085684.1 thiol reductant ABC exporter subunit CydC [Limosilactobacillus fastidiosus]MCD7083856.1 thiol reductant ABC exporter subunit CydC [Limosilactobacillus fastidiosus]MCD7086163.1 thiol reductant ABC exporter subunit CydC [Limosilactobacillus fastidiosus]MCD7114024.1 thiol reductant ABC exporter subunit CydC [Limosilactob